MSFVQDDELDWEVLGGSAFSRMGRSLQSAVRRASETSRAWRVLVDIGHRWKAEPPRTRYACVSLLVATAALTHVLAMQATRVAGAYWLIVPVIALVFSAVAALLASRLPIDASHS